MRRILGFLLVTACPGLLPAQAVPFSQHASVSQRIGATDVSIDYSRPVARGRVLFGPNGVVRPGRIWTPGADSATHLTVSRPVLIEGHPLSAGRYSIWLEPAVSGPWTLIISRAADVLHIPYPGSDQDVFRASVTPETGSHMDALAFYFPVVAPDSAVLRMHWGETVVPIVIHTTP